MPDSDTEDYFNDLSQQPPAVPPAGNNENTPKAKRIACSVCRKRKLRCDGERPSCGTCKRLSHDCSYDDVRRKSGPKRGYVKALEARLAQVETLLQNKDANDGSKNDVDINIMDMGGNDPSTQSGLQPVPETENMMFNNNPNTNGAGLNGMAGDTLGDGLQGNANNIPADEPFPWEMIGLGLEEPLPSQEVINELHQAYFDKVHPSMPIIHRPRYYAAMNLAPHMRPPIALRYIIWCSAAAVLDKYSALHETFYIRARKYGQLDEMRGHGEATISVAHAQAWLLISAYEFRCMYFPRAWLSVGKASRLVQMMGLQRLDGTGLDVKQTVAPPRDWTEREERRRTFWQAFCQDRYASVGTGWPMTIDERDILTNLPATEEAFEKSKPARSITLAQALEPNGAQHLTSFGGIVLLACLFGRNLTHLHRPEPDDNEEDVNGAFWKRHRGLESILLSTALSLPDHLRLPQGLNDSNVIFMNMNIHTSVICLHQAAIFKAERNKLTTNIASESKVRCISAATEIASIMRMICHMDLSAMNPFIAFCIYVAARVLLQYLRTRTTDSQVRSSLQFLVSALHALTKKNPLTESFLCQLDVDLEGAGISLNPGPLNPAAKWAKAIQIEQIQNDAVCVPIMEIRESQAEGRTPNNNFKSPTPGVGSMPNIPNVGQGTQSPMSNDNNLYSYDVDHSGANSTANFGATSPESVHSLPTRSKKEMGMPFGMHRSSVDGSGVSETSPSASGMHDEATPGSSVPPPAQSSRTSNSYTPDHRDNMQYPGSASTGFTTSMSNNTMSSTSGMFSTNGVTTDTGTSAAFNLPASTSMSMNPDGSASAAYFPSEFNAFGTQQHDFNNMPMVDWDMNQEGHTGFTPAGTGPWDQMGDSMAAWTAQTPNPMSQHFQNQT